MEYEEGHTVKPGASTTKSGTELLLEQAAKVEEAKTLKIQELLDEKTSIVKLAMDRVEEIKVELKALGYHPLRKKTDKSTETVVESLDKSQANS